MNSFFSSYNYLWTNYPKDSNQFGELVLKHSGVYAARFFISWEEVTCIDGISHTTTKYWENNCHRVFEPYSATILIPMSATNICIKAEAFTGNVQCIYKTILDKKGLTMVTQRNLKIWGTNLDPQYSMNPC